MKFDQGFFFIKQEKIDYINNNNNNSKIKEWKFIWNFGFLWFFKIWLIDLGRFILGVYGLILMQ